MNKFTAFLSSAISYSVLSIVQAQPCPLVNTLTVPIAGNTTEQASVRLIGANTIHTGKTTYLAGQVIELVSGFEVRPGAGFEAYLSACKTADFTHSDREEVLSLTASPNPFSKSTLIEYMLPISSTVNISITDMRGITIASLVSNQPQQEGVHKTAFEPDSLPDGVYICVIDTPYGRKSIRILRRK